MAGFTYLGVVNGIKTLLTAIQTSAGAGDAGKAIAANSAGKLDDTFLPAGIGADTKSCPGSEALSAGNLVNLWSDAGTLKARKADGSNARPAHGFVKASTDADETVTVYKSGTNANMSGLTPGVQYYLSGATAGGVVVGSSVPSTTGGIIQDVGVALSATELSFEPQEPTYL